MTINLSSAILFHLFCYIEMGETIDQALSTLFLNEPQEDIPLSLSFQSCYR